MSSISLYESTSLIQVLPLLASTAIVFACSALEDFRGTSPLMRLCVHGIAAALFLWWSGSYSVPLLPVLPEWLTAAGLGFFIVWMANLYNFMDGADGLAGGMAAIGFAFVGIGGFAAGAPHVGIVAALLAASAAGFLIENFPPARVFLGDAGSVPFGFLAAAVSVQLAHDGRVPPLQPALAFAPFLIDATFTLLRRVLAGKAFWRPHREHWYQRLVRGGWTHRRTSLLYYGLMLISGLASLLYGISPLGAVLAVAGAHLVLPLAATWREKGVLRSVET